MKLKFDSNDTKNLFLRYAIPCGNVLVKRKTISKDKLDKMKVNLINGRDIRDIEKTFKVASSMCYIITRKMKKNKIDKAVIRKYFWSEHAKAIEWRHNIYKDFDKKLCRVYPGRVTSIGEKAIVLTPIGKRELRTDFVSDLMKNDLVTVHYDYIVEKITKKEFNSLWNKYK